jgi:hypothetical protein
MRSFFALMQSYSQYTCSSTSEKSGQENKSTRYYAKWRAVAVDVVYASNDGLPVAPYYCMMVMLSYVHCNLSFLFVPLVKRVRS